MKKKEPQQHYYNEEQLEKLDTVAELKKFYNHKDLPSTIKKNLLRFIRALRASVGDPIA